MGFLYICWGRKTQTGQEAAENYSKNCTYIYTCTPKDKWLYRKWEDKINKKFPGENTLVNIGKYVQMQQWWEKCKLSQHSVAIFYLSDGKILKNLIQSVLMIHGEEFIHSFSWIISSYIWVFICIYSIKQCKMFTFKDFSYGHFIHVFNKICT